MYMYYNCESITCTPVHVYMPVSALNFSQVPSSGCSFRYIRAAFAISAGPLAGTPSAHSWTNHRKTTLSTSGKSAVLTMQHFFIQSSFGSWLWNVFSLSSDLMSNTVEFPIPYSSEIREELQPFLERSQISNFCLILSTQRFRFWGVTDDILRTTAQAGSQIKKRWRQNSKTWNSQTTNDRARQNTHM